MTYLKQLKPTKGKIKKLTKEAQREYQEIKLRLDSLIKQAYLRGKIDALEGIDIDLERNK